MNHSHIHAQIDALFEMARKDSKYALMNRRYKFYEAVLEHMSQKLGEEDQNVLWEFICLSEDMNWRMLELICERFLGDWSVDEYMELCDR